MTQHGRNHQYDVDDKVTLTFDVSGYIDSDGDFVPEQSLTGDYDSLMKGYHPQLNDLIDHLNGESYISGQFIDDNPDMFRAYGAPRKPSGPPITDEDLKEALASIIGTGS